VDLNYLQFNYIFSDTGYLRNIFGEVEFMHITERYKGKSLLIGAFLLMAAILVVVVSFITSAHSEWSKTVFMDTATTLVNLMAALTLFAAALASRHRSRRLVIAWLILALAQFAYVLGDATWMVLEVFLHQEPFPSLADGFYIAYYPLFLLGILLLPAYRLTRMEWVKTSLDLAIVLLAASLTFWNFLLGPLVSLGGEDTILAELLTLAYPVGDLLLLWAVLVVIYRQAQDQDPRPLLLITLSASVMFVADYFYGYQSLLDVYTSGGLVDLGWVVAYLIAGLAGIWQIVNLKSYPVSGEVQTEHQALRDRSTTWITFTPYVWLAAAYTLLIFSDGQSLPMSFSWLAASVGIMIGLVLIRQAITLADNSHLSQKLQGALESVQQQRVALEQTNLELQVEVEERKRAEDQLVHDALHDSLTGLPNRVLLSDRLDHALEYSRRRSDYHFSVLFLDLDHFKVVNDSLGHPAGDRLLVMIADRLRGCTRASDTIARLSGDEFVILLEDADDCTAFASAQRCQEVLTPPFHLEPHDIFISSSVGIVHSEPGYQQAEDILRDADIAMYKAKTSGKARCLQFHPSMRERAMTRLEMENDLRQALGKGEFFLNYQPIISLHSNQISGMEALIRWQHPTRGIVPPAEFIPIAEETGLLIPIGNWVLKEACRQMREWQVKYPRKPALTISVNISPSQLCQPDFSTTVEQILRETGLDGSNLRLEITESVYLTSYETFAALFARLSAIGVQFQIDDFGTGYSSLSYLQFFPIHTIKIDRAFTNRIASNDRQDIVRTIIGLAHELGMDAIAEGVETEEQLKGLQEYGCNYVQGYLLSRPLDKATVEELIRGREVPKPTFLLSPSSAVAD
jgi:diguanylate cyclase (GGDEF)-like protein